MSWPTLSPWGKETSVPEAAKKEKALFVFLQKGRKMGFREQLEHHCSVRAPDPSRLCHLPHPCLQELNMALFGITQPKAQLCPGQRQLPHSQRPISLQCHWPDSNATGSHTFIFCHTAPQHSLVSSAHG